MQKLKAVAERLTLPAVLVHFFRFAPTAIECGSRDVSRMMGPDIGGGVLDRQADILARTAAISK